MLWAEAK